MNKDQAVKLKALVILSFLCGRGVVSDFKKKLTYRLEHAEFVIWRYEQTRPKITRAEIIEGIPLLFECEPDDVKDITSILDNHISEEGDLYDANEE